MASAPDDFDAVKVRHEIFQPGKRNIRMTMEFVAEMIRILSIKRRKKDFVFLTDKSIQILQGNFQLKKYILRQIVTCNEEYECSDMLKYYLEFEKTLNDSVTEKKERMVILLKIAQEYYLTSHYRKTLKYAKKAEIIAREFKDKSGQALCYEAFGHTYFGLSDYKTAIDYYQKSLEITTAIGNRSGIANSNGNLGNAYCSLGEYEKAIDYYQKGLEISTAIGDRSGIAGNHGNLGNAYCYLGEYKKAIDNYQEGLEINTAIGDRSGIAINNGNLGNVYRRLGEYEKAINYYKKGVEISTAIGDLSKMAYNNGNLGSNYFILSRSELDIQKTVSIVEQAVVYLKESVKCIDQIFLTLNVDQNKISFTKQFYKYYVTLMCCFIFLKRIQAALLVIDVGKAKALHAFLEKRRKWDVEKRKKPEHDVCKILERIDSNEEKMETEEIQKTLKLQISNSFVLFYSFDNDEFLNIWVLNGENGVRHIILRESEEMNSVEDYIYEKLAKLLKSFSVELNRDSSFCELESDSTPGWEVNVPPIQSGGKSVNKKSGSFDLSKTERRLVPKQHSLEITPESPNFPDNVLRRLFQSLIAPVTNLIKGAKLIIIPDKFLFFIPFCSLLDENGFRVSENYSIQITPSLHTLVSSMTRSRDPILGFALFLGNPTVGKVIFRGNELEPSPLHNAEKEVKFLADFHFKTQPLVKDDATKERVLKFIPGASIIHIAAHGEPNHGEILLSPNPNATEGSSSLPKEDSYLLKQQDIMKINIKARFVVLSCCHTGQGKVSSEGVVGLTRAFLAAGARSVLATLWPIHDEGTKEFMKVFYDNICQGISVCEALKMTMNIFQRHENQEIRAFGIWAPFTIYGEDVKFTKDDIEEIKQKSREMSF